jgi:hypothetical protein
LDTSYINIIHVLKNELMQFVDFFYIGNIIFIHIIHLSQISFYIQVYFKMLILYNVMLFVVSFFFSFPPNYVKNQTANASDGTVDHAVPGLSISRDGSSSTTQNPSSSRVDTILNTDRTDPDQRKYYLYPYYTPFTNFILHTSIF